MWSFHAEWPAFRQVYLDVLVESGQRLEECTHRLDTQYEATRPTRERFIELWNRKAMAKEERQQESFAYRKRAGAEAQNRRAMAAEEQLQRRVVAGEYRQQRWNRRAMAAEERSQRRAAAAERRRESQSRRAFEQEDRRCHTW